MANYDQEDAKVCKDLLKTKDGINRLALYHSSIGRFSNAPGAMIYPIYGQGELPQAFCRRAAVKGCIYVLRMPVISLLMDKDTNSYKGVKLVSGQEIFSHKLLLAPSFVLPPLIRSATDVLQDSPHAFCPRSVNGMVARGICISTTSLRPEVMNCLAFYPPRSLYPEQLTAIRIFQLSSNVAVCPSGMFVTYLSTICDDAVQGKKSVHAAIHALFSLPNSEGSENKSTVDQMDNSEVKPALLWSALYIQEVSEGAPGCIGLTPMPDGNIHYNDILDATVKIFHKMYPNEDFFPKTSEETMDDGGSELDS